MPRISGSPALAKLRILDLSRARAGPVCSRHFADFGADVLKIESTAPDDFIGARDRSDFQNLHRNKRSMLLDLKSDAHRDIFFRLVETADVVIENYRPAVKERLKIGYEALRSVNKRIILASISGFGEDGPYRDRPGVDQIVQGMSGMMSVNGNPGDGPLRAGFALTDVATGLLAAMGIMTALLERESSGEGQWVQVNLLQSAIQLLDFQAARYTVSGEVPEKTGNDHPTGIPSSTYKTADGYINLAGPGVRMWQEICDAIGQPELATHPDYNSRDARSRNRTALNELLNKGLSTKATAVWVEHFSKVGVPCGPVYAMDQVFADPQVKHIEATAEVTHPRLGKLRLVNQPVKLLRTPARLVTATPETGQHTGEVLRELGYDEAEISRLTQSGTA